MAISSRDLNQQFSTFADLSNDHVCWQELPRLTQSMELQRTEYSLQQEETSTPDFWVAYWHQRWQKRGSQELPKAHLYAYLQEPCYWNAQDLFHRFNPTNLEVADCFQTAICRSEQILHNFNPASGASLSTYASRAFGNAIRDALDHYDSLSICSDLSLLRRASRKLLKEALASDSIPQAMGTSHEAAWQCFRAVFFPQSRTVRNLTDLTKEDWVAIAKEYSQLKATQPGLAVGGDIELRHWLHNCVVALRRYQRPSSVSLNNTGLNEEQEFLDQLVDDQADGLAQLYAQETEQARQALRQQVARVLSDAVNQLEEPGQTLLQLYYHEGLKQVEIAERLGTDQSQISRHLRKIRQTLLKALVRWSREELHISEDPPVLKDMSLLLQDWLTLQFSGERKEHVAA